MYFERYFGARPKEPNSEEECWNMHPYFMINFDLVSLCQRTLLRLAQVIISQASEK